MLIKCYAQIDEKMDERAEFMCYLIILQLHNKLELE